MSDKVSKAHQIMNYPGLPAVTGADMAKAFEKQLAMMEIDITDSRIGTVYAMGDYFAIHLKIIALNLIVYNLYVFYHTGRYHHL